MGGIPVWIHKAWVIALPGSGKRVKSQPQLAFNPKSPWYTVSGCGFLPLYPLLDRRHLKSCVSGIAVREMPTHWGCTFSNPRCKAAPAGSPEEGLHTLFRPSYRMGVALLGAFLFLPCRCAVSSSLIHPVEPCCRTQLTAPALRRALFLPAPMGVCWPTWKRFSATPGCFLFCP